MVSTLARNASNSKRGFASLVSQLRNFSAWRWSAKLCAGAIACFALMLIGLSLAGVSSGSVVAWCLGVPVFIAVMSGLRLRGFHWSTVTVLGGALLMYMSYVGYTTHAERNFDVSHQVKYIEYIVQNLKPPPDDYCFICHHPPLYYGLSAGVYGFTKSCGIAEPLRGVQMLSLASVFAFTIAMAAIMRRSTKNPWIMSLGTALCGLWPYTIIHSARVHNDVLAMSLMAWAMYACVRWYQNPLPKWMITAAVLCILSVTTKSNGYVMVALLFTTVVYRVCFPPEEERRAGRSRRFSTVKLALPLFLAMAVGLGSYAKLRGANKVKKEDAQENVVADENPEMTERLLGSAAKIGERAWMHNEPYNYLYFDLRGFLEEPYIMAKVDGTGRQLYFNHLLKSSLFSTHNEHPDAETSYRINRRLASVLNWLLLLICVYVVYFAAQCRKEDFRRNFVLVAAFFGLLAGGLAFRIVVPHAHHSDFRHIIPILIPGCAAFALGVQHFSSRRSLMSGVGLLLCSSFLGLTLLYFAPKYRWIQKHSPVEWTEKRAPEMRKWVKAGTNWNATGNVVLEGTDGLKVQFLAKPTAHKLAISLDNNDKYQITLVGENESRTIEVGPHPDKKPGMGEYLVEIDPPVARVEEVLVRPLLGDHAYSIGHLVLDPTPQQLAESGDSKIKPATPPPPRAKPQARPEPSPVLPRPNRGVDEKPDVSPDSSKKSQPLPRPVEKSLRSAGEPVDED